MGGCYKRGIDLGEGKMLMVGTGDDRGTYMRPTAPGSGCADVERADGAVREADGSSRGSVTVH